MRKTLDIMIVNWNSRAQLHSCLSSIVEAQNQAVNINRIVVVDNASTDSSLEGLHLFNLPLITIRNEENRGFSVACNQGAKDSSADYLLFLNPDTKLSENSLSETIIFMENPNNRQIGICGINLIDQNGDSAVSCARFPTLRMFLGAMTRLNKVFPDVFPNQFMSANELQQSGRVDQIIGAFFLVRRKVYDEIGGFDERFFVYYEEVDFALRAREKGYSSFFLANVNAIHSGGGCSNKIKSQRLFYSLRSRMQYAYKHYSKMESFGLLVLTLSVELIARLSKALITGSFSSLKEVLLGYYKLAEYYVLIGIESGHNR